MTKVASTQRRNEIEKKKRSTKSKVARPNDLTVTKNGAKKIKLAREGVVEPVVKIEQDCEQGGSGNRKIKANKKTLRNRKPKQTQRMCHMRDCKY